MENPPSKSINCCFCDKDLSQKTCSKPSVTVRYKCPGCERVYCSADCFGGHKEKFSCSGVRNKTPYIHLANFDQKQFIDDYLFLEEVNNRIDSAHRSLSESTKGISRSNISKKRKWRSRVRRQNKKKTAIE